MCHPLQLTPRTCNTTQFYVKTICQKNMPFHHWILHWCAASFVFETKLQLTQLKFFFENVLQFESTYWISEYLIHI